MVISGNHLDRWSLKIFFWKGLFVEAIEFYLFVRRIFCILHEAVSSIIHMRSEKKLSQ